MVRNGKWHHRSQVIIRHNNFGDYILAMAMQFEHLMAAATSIPTQTRAPAAPAAPVLTSPYPIPTTQVPATYTQAPSPPPACMVNGSDVSFIARCIW